MPDGNYLKIGIFVLVGFGLLVAGFLVFGLQGHLNSSSVLCVTFFNRSVQGISKDAAVKYRGFTIGRVVSLSLAAADDLSGQPMVRVDFEIDPATFAIQVPDPDDVPNFLRAEIAKGLKVYLTFQGVTGLGFLNLDYGQEDQLMGANALEAARLIARNVDLVYIPSGPSQIFEIGEAIGRLLRTMNDIDLVGISREIKQAIQTIDQSLVALDAGRLSRDISGALEEIRELSASLRISAGHIDELFSSPGEGGRGQAASAGQLRQSLKRLDQLLASSQGGLPETLDNLRATAENLREMSELLKNQPSQVLFGSPPRAAEPGRARRPENVTTFNLP
ncbi:MAG: MlaD family protein [Candidatus Adiutrix sp.]|jgi:ABC-type transporter Mla subunit MlaD|nr:MlaD family protein [Candidatus Adiutrix sp.]